MFLIPSDQLLLWDFSPGLHQFGPVPVYRPCHPYVLPQESLGRPDQLHGCLVFLLATLHYRPDLSGSCKGWETEPNKVCSQLFHVH